MKVGDLVQHVDIPKKCRIVGVVVETHVDLNICEVVWVDRGLEAFWHFNNSLEVVK